MCGEPVFREVNQDILKHNNKSRLAYSIWKSNKIVINKPDFHIVLGVEVSCVVSICNCKFFMLCESIIDGAGWTGMKVFKMMHFLFFSAPAR